jgi:hypothetical protein
VTSTPISFSARAKASLRVYGSSLYSFSSAFTSAAIFWRVSASIGAYRAA